MSQDVREGNQRLWMIALSPAIWALHFMLCYGTAAIWCAKRGPASSLTTVQLVIAGYTLVALAAVALVGWRALRRHRLGGEAPPHDEDTPEDRHRFLGLATLMLSGLSAVAIVYAAMAALFFESCR